MGGDRQRSRVQGNYMMNDRGEARRFVVRISAGNSVFLIVIRKFKLAKALDLLLNSGRRKPEK